MAKEMTEAQRISRNKRQQKWTDTKDRINFVMPKGRKDEIKVCAERAGISAAEWINNAILAYMSNSADSGVLALDSIPDLQVYAKSVGLIPEEYVKRAVIEKMERQDLEYMEEIVREKVID